MEALQSSALSYGSCRTSPVSSAISRLRFLKRTEKFSSSVSFVYPSIKVQKPRSSLLKGHATTGVSQITLQQPSAERSEFIEACEKGNLIPLCRCIFSDHFTPVLAYRCLVKEDDREAPSFLFESVEQGYKSTNVGRYSIVGAQPIMEIVAKENMVTIVDHEKQLTDEDFYEDPMSVPPKIMSQWRPVVTDELPAAFCGGWVGYFSYDTVRYVEKRKLPFSNAPEDDRMLPDMHLGLYNDIVVFDHVEKGIVTNRPLAGTRRRGRTDKEDEMQEKDLLNDSKECAEHVMLVDLGRNDVGKVSKPGTVNVEKFMTIERYSHVMHISSTVTGALQDNLSSWDALRAALPVGTVSGAPKVKAMELIDELEPTRRGPYSGGIGGVSFTGDMDIALALRTMVFKTGPRYDTMYSYKDASKRRDWAVHLQAGAGIVADSNPDDEHRECINKAAALGRAIDLAEATFVNE
eukprot:TRINITY_DN9478_c0_g1_i1.p1 TRINITY_DN9478_c0_g1~~TRINITY_DN9478_c0_g1_i1.p1  ORF type:complete len:463 (+),score=100.56 TRINITY_DN9478_c0_g1_i1:285-1673(+)